MPVPRMSKKLYSNERIIFFIGGMNFSRLYRSTAYICELRFYKNTFLAKKLKFFVTVLTGYSKENNNVSMKSRYDFLVEN